MAAISPVSEEPLPPVPRDLAGLALPVLDLAISVGERILAIRDKGYAVDTKADRSLVTDADTAAEAMILDALERLTPGVPIIAEESHTGSTGPASPGDPWWLVDPLDGTRDFVARGMEFAVSIGMIIGGRPRFGVIHGPGLGLSYWTAGDGTAMRARGTGAEERIAARIPPRQGLTVITSRFHGASGRLDAYLASLPVARRLLTSSALKFGRIAEGSADLYPRFGPTSEWDTAAGEAILVAAGGSLHTMEGRPLAYGKAGYLNPDFVARGRSG